MIRSTMASALAGLTLAMAMGVVTMAEAKQMVLPGRVAKDNVMEVNNNVRWHTNLNSALARAHREQKMVLWIHMVGKIDGAT